VRMKCGVRKVIALLGVLLFVSTAVTACGDSSGSSGGTSFTVKASEFEFDNTEWSVPAGESISITFINEGQVQHEWAVVNLGMDIDKGSEFTEDHVLWEIEKQDGGVTVTESYTFDTPGTYQVICALEGHVDAGMVRTLVAS